MNEKLQSEWGRAPPVRAAAFKLLLEWDKSKTVFIEDLLHEHLAKYEYSPEDAGLLSYLCYGVVRHRNTLKFVSQLFARLDLLEYPRALRVGLALGIFQLVYLRTPAHAAVDETVKGWDLLAERAVVPLERRERGRGFLNACLRRAAERIRFVSDGEVKTVTASDPVANISPAAIADATADSRPADSPDSPTGAIMTPAEGWVQVEGLEKLFGSVIRPQVLATQYSHPVEMVRIWGERWPEEKLISFMQRNNQIPDTYLVLKSLSQEIFRRRLQGVGIPVENTSEAKVMRIRGGGGGNIDKLPGYDTGDFWVQDITAYRLANMMPVKPDARLLDLCAAPGGKLCTLLARGNIREATACDLSEEKLQLILENLNRMNFEECFVKTMLSDEDPTKLRLHGGFSQAIVDAPCSNSGVLARRHEARWRLLPENIKPLQRQQRLLLKSAAQHLERGADLLYLTCSVEPAENREVVDDFLRSAPDFRLIEEREYIPAMGVEGDGGYGALMQKVR